MAKGLLSLKSLSRVNSQTLLYEIHHLLFVLRQLRVEFAVLKVRVFLIIEPSWKYHLIKGGLRAGVDIAQS